MDADTKKEFDRQSKNFDELARAMADGFTEVKTKLREEMVLGFTDVRSDIKELREEIKSIRKEIEALPDRIDATYAGTINDLLERVTALESHLGIAK